MLAGERCNDDQRGLGELIMHIERLQALRDRVNRMPKAAAT
jgi:hypothetical protein